MEKSTTYRRRKDVRVNDIEKLYILGQSHNVNEHNTYGYLP